MKAELDNYVAYYADKLWNLIPSIYRFEDTDVFDRPGPLRELVNRIGWQAAILRRATDRLWEDQSIETCDDWVIPYIADLLDTRLVPGLDARGQRLNVAKTIYYRRRKGTVALLEELATDISGWNVVVVEFFRRLGRTRHGLDPQVGIAAGNMFENQLVLLEDEKLIGPLTGTACGGYADLHQPYGASKTGTAFDEYFHTADVRRGLGRAGWYDIPRLGVFLWRLYSLSAGLGFDENGQANAGVTPVKASACPGNFSYFSFDPTGREIPLFAVASRPFGDSWGSAEEWRLPTPISSGLLKHDFANLYGSLLSVTDNIIDFRSLSLTDGQGHLIGSDAIATEQADFLDLAQTGKTCFIDPAKGLLYCKGTVPENLSVVYHYGFASEIGAVEYDRTAFTGQAWATPAGDIKVSGGQAALSTQLATLGTTGSLTIEDSLTYNAVGDLTGIQNVLLRSQNLSRPLIRLPEASPGSHLEWVFNGADDDAELSLDGLFISGGDVVLTGHFKSVTLTSCTFDPGTLKQDGSGYEPAVDQRELAPSYLWIDGHVQNLVISRCVMGPINERAKGGLVDQLLISDSIVQSIDPKPAIHMSLGILAMERCTVMGQADVHRLKASDSLLDGIFTVINDQDGCIRFSAWTTGSRLPRRYECAEIPPVASIFMSRHFGRSAYAQLVEGVDTVVINPDSTISEGAENGSEIGVFSNEQYPIKLRALNQKFQEYMPIGLTPVFINVT